MEATGRSGVRRRLRLSRLIAGIALAGLVVLIAVFVLWRHRSREGKTVAIHRGLAVEAVFGIGTVTAVREFEVKSGVSSGIIDRYVEEGDEVKRGDPLLRLSEGGLVRAPFVGTVSSVAYNPGESVFQGDVIMSLVDRSNMYLLVTLDQRAAVRVRPGLEARINFDGLRETTFMGRVRSVFSNRGRFMTHLDVPDGFPPRILPGMTADVGIVINRKENALLIPAAALVDGKVTYDRNGRRAETPVTTGIVDSGMVEIVGGGLRDGDKVLLPQKSG